jgi:DNA-binding transcriptional MerR regulator
MNVKSEAMVALPPIPAKRYFTIGEVSDLCGVKPHVLRYWEQEFTQLRPMKRRGNRRYYQHHEVLLVRRIRELLYEEGFTINGARNRLSEMSGARPRQGGAGEDAADSEVSRTEPGSGVAAQRAADISALGDVARMRSSEVTDTRRESRGQQGFLFEAELANGPQAVREALQQALDLLR